MFIHVLLLVCALCVDTFTAGIAYGADRVKLTLPQIGAVSGICSLCLGISLIFGNIIDILIPETFTTLVCCSSLFFLGALKLIDSAIRHYLKYHESVRRDICFSISSLSFIISIYTDPLEADEDRNKILSWRETFFFSIAMSIDSLISGTMAAFLKIPVLLTVLASFLVGVVFICSGLFVGARIQQRLPFDLSWMSGILFIVLAVIRY